MIPMLSVPHGVSDNVSMNCGQSPAVRRHYHGGSPSRHRYHDSSYDSYMERPLLQSSHTTPCRRAGHYDACAVQSEAHWNDRDGGVRATVLHRGRTAAAPPQPPSATHGDEHLDDRAEDRPVRGCGAVRHRSQAQMVDIVSRILFPCMFLIFNIVYWPYYLFFCAP